MHTATHLKIKWTTKHFHASAPRLVIARSSKNDELEEMQKFKSGLGQALEAAAAEAAGMLNGACGGAACQASGLRIILNLL